MFRYLPRVAILHLRFWRSYNTQTDIVCQNAYNLDDVKIPAQSGISPPYTLVSQSSADDTQAGQGACKFAHVKIPAQSSISSPHTLEGHGSVDDAQNDSSKSNTDKVRPLNIAKPAGSTLTSIAEAASTTPGDLAPDLGYSSDSSSCSQRAVPTLPLGAISLLIDFLPLGYQGCQPKDPDCQPITVFWEVKQGEAQVSEAHSRLRKCLGFWEETLNPVPWIISCISEGYKFPLRVLPNRYCRPNQQSASDNKNDKML